jgi:hypothetical protein
MASLFEELRELCVNCPESQSPAIVPDARCLRRTASAVRAFAARQDGSKGDIKHNMSELSKFFGKFSQPPCPFETFVRTGAWSKAPHGSVSGSIGDIGSQH